MYHAGEGPCGMHNQSFWEPSNRNKGANAHGCTVRGPRALHCPPPARHACPQRGNGRPPLTCRTPPACPPPRRACRWRAAWPRAPCNPPAATRAGGTAAPRHPRAPSRLRGGRGGARVEGSAAAAAPGLRGARATMRRARCTLRVCACVRAAMRGRPARVWASSSAVCCWLRLQQPLALQPCSEMLVCSLMRCMVASVFSLMPSCFWRVACGACARVRA